MKGKVIASMVLAVAAFLTPLQADVSEQCAEKVHPWTFSARKSKSAVFDFLRISWTYKFHEIRRAVHGAASGSISETPKTKACPKDMALIPGGEYLLGADTWWREWAKERKRVTIRTFCMDRHEYPNTPGKPPRTKVSWEEARRTCAEAGKRLCAMDEWMAACQGKAGRYYVYGPKKDVRKCNTDGQLLRGAQDILPAGTFPECVSPEGVYDLNGNVSEWVRDETAGRKRWLMGGTAWFSDWYGQDCTSRHAHPADSKHFDDGFRCCKDVE